MRKISTEASLDTLIKIEVTLKELLNISSAIDLTMPPTTIEYMKDIYGLTEDEAKNIAVVTQAHGPDIYIAHKLFHEMHEILNEYGYEFEAEAYSNMKENQSND